MFGSLICSSTECTNPDSLLVTFHTEEGINNPKDYYDKNKENINNASNDNSNNQHKMGHRSAPATAGHDGCAPPALQDTPWQDL